MCCSEIQHRRSIRLKRYDYSEPGYYFFTICIHDRSQKLFGDIIFNPPVVGAGSKPALCPALNLNEYGNIVNFTWNDLPNHIPGIELDEFVVMPNHVHGIIRIIGSDLQRDLQRAERAGLEPAPTDKLQKRIVLSEIIRQFKTFSAKRINTRCNMYGISLWQRNYYEHIIRNEVSLNTIRKYINENPLNWKNDSENHINQEIDKFKMTEINSR